MIPYRVAPSLGDEKENIVLICKDRHKEVNGQEENFETLFFEKINCNIKIFKNTHDFC